MKWIQILSRLLLITGVLSLVASLVSAIGIWFFEIPQLGGIILDGLVVMYFSFLIKTYIDEKPIRFISGGFSLTRKKNPFLYRMIYVFFFMWGAILSAIFLSAKFEI
jgi:hypothetical protein